jgi:uncharacterized protein YueI
MDREKSKLEEKVLEGIYGNKEIKRDEKRRFLGEYKERVIRYLTFEQVIEEGVYPEIIEAFKKPEASKLIIDRRINLKAAHDYIKQARNNNISFKRISSPDLKGNIALVVVSDHAVEIEERKVIERKKRLQKAGISDKIIGNVGSKLCDDCWNILRENAPEELVNYKRMSFIDRLIGTECISCKGIHK